MEADALSKTGLRQTMKSSNIKETRPSIVESQNLTQAFNALRLFSEQ